MDSVATSQLDQRCPPPLDGRMTLRCTSSSPHHSSTFPDAVLRVTTRGDGPAWPRLWPGRRWRGWAGCRLTACCGASPRREEHEYSRRASPATARLLGSSPHDCFQVCPCRGVWFITYTRVSTPPSAACTRGRSACSPRLWLVQVLHSCVCPHGCWSALWVFSSHTMHLHTFSSCRVMQAAVVRSSPRNVTA